MITWVRKAPGWYASLAGDIHNTNSMEWCFVPSFICIGFSHAPTRAKTLAEMQRMVDAWWRVGPPRQRKRRGRRRDSRAGVGFVTEW